MMPTGPVDKSVKSAEAGSIRRAQLSRRSFLRTVCHVGCGVAGGASILGAACEVLPTLPEPEVRPPLLAGPELRASGTLTAGAGALFEMGEEGRGIGWGYNGRIPGPLVRLHRGEELDIRLRNRLPEATTVHWHGMLAPPSMDGHPADAVEPGGQYHYRFPVAQRAGTHWYHPHPHGRTGAQAALGLAGLLVVEDEGEAALDLPAGEREIPLVVRDGQIDARGRLTYQRDDRGTLGDFALINGVAYPRRQVSRDLHRLRLLNASNARVYRLAIPGLPLVLIGNDGGLLETPHHLRELTLGPGERADVLVDFGALPTGASAPLRCLRAGWDLLVFGATSAASRPGRIPETLPPSDLPEMGPPRRERDFVFEGHTRINGRRYEMGRIDFRVPFGETELWRFRSHAGAPHPVHVHGTHFRVVSRSGGRGRVFPWEAGLKDTVLVEEGETVEVLVRFQAHRGIYLIHCHKLEHEDRGMMMDFEVV